MKLLQVFPLVFMTLFFPQCNSVTETSNPLIGTWMLVTSERVENGAKIPVRNIESTSKYIKTINESHFTTLWQDAVNPEDGGYNGGNYQYRNGLYTEYLEYHSKENLRNKVVHFKVELLGELLILQSCDDKGEPLEHGFVETWKRTIK